MAVVRIVLFDTKWGNHKLTCLVKFKRALANNFKLTHRDNSLRLSPFTDCSGAVWYCIPTQVPPTDLQFEF